MNKELTGKEVTVWEGVLQVQWRVGAMLGPGMMPRWGAEYRNGSFPALQRPSCDLAGG